MHLQKPIKIRNYDNDYGLDLPNVGSFSNKRHSSKTDTSIASVRVSRADTHSISRRNMRRKQNVFRRHHYIEPKVKQVEDCKQRMYKPYNT